MKKYVLSFAASIAHKPEHPERTARRQMQSFDVQYCVWPSRAAMLKTIEMQEKRAARYDDWRAVCKSLPVANGAEAE